MKSQLMLSTYYFGFRDKTIIVERDGLRGIDELRGIADDADFLTWALDNGYQACAVCVNGILCWDFIPTRIDLQNHLTFPKGAVYLNS